jgi:tetratricopeptide (TPR) repeat protein
VGAPPDTERRAWAADLADAIARLSALPQAADEPNNYRRACILIEVGQILVTLGRFQEAAEPLSTAESILATQPQRKQALATALYLRAVAADGLGNHEQALDLLEKTRNVGMRHEAPALARRTTNLRLNLLLTLERFPQALSEAQAVLDSGHGRQSMPDRQAVADAYATEARAAQRLGQLDRALRAIECAITEWSDIHAQTSDPEAHDMAARLMFARAGILDDRGDRKAARTAFQEFTRFVAGTSTPTLHRSLLRARAGLQAR